MLLTQTYGSLTILNVSTVNGRNSVSQPCYNFGCLSALASLTGYVLGGRGRGENHSALIAVSVRSPLHLMHIHAYSSSPSSSSSEDDCVQMETSPTKRNVTIDVSCSTPASSSLCNPNHGEPPSKRCCRNEDEDPFGLDDFFVRVCGRSVNVRDQKSVPQRFSHLMTQRRSCSG
ncbi:unnamed protein product [Cylicocyclus nassatus]|uniref:Uncharacterized protein n=1 Tax=Cylicocyclus nassatus TaxID=53992 RepID=A0AA36GJ66_CYLNA|nr:unnamed protein product [Cylicocyclus nassatus]